MARTIASIVVVVALAFLAAQPAWAQQPYAMSAMGQNVEIGTARDTGRGGWGMAASDTLTPGTLNQAALGDLRFLGLVFSGFGMTTDSETADETRTTSRTVVPNIRLAVPLRSGQLTLHGGFLVKRSMEWEVRTDIAMEQFGNAVTGTERYRRTGSLWQVPVGLAWRLRPGLSVGASYNWVGGSIEDQISQVFGDPRSSPYYLANVRGQLDNLKGQCITASVLLDALRFLQLGASYTNPYELTAEREVSLADVAYRRRSTLDYEMPAEYRAGVMVRLPGHWRLGADGYFSPFSEFTGREDWEAIMVDEWTVSAGIERIYVRAQRGGGYQVPVRAGYQYHQWAHTVGGSEVREHTVSVGTGFPFRNRLGMIDLALSYSWAGDLQRNGYRTETWRLGLSIVGLERLIF
jgi:hypothetical protein